MNEVEFYYLAVDFNKIVLASRLILFFVALFVIFNNSNNRKIMPIFWYSFIALLLCIFDVLLIQLAIARNKTVLNLLEKYDLGDNFFTSPFYFVNDLVFLSAFYSKLLLKKQIFWIGLFLVFVEIINTCFFEGFRKPQNIATMVNFLYILFLSSYFIRYCYLNKLKTSVIKNSSFVISISIAIPLIFSFLFHLFTDLLFNKYTKLFYQLSLFKLIFESIGYLGMAYGIWFAKRSFR